MIPLYIGGSAKSRMKIDKLMDVVTLETKKLRLQIPRTFGPRILSLQLIGGANLLAELPDFAFERPDGKIYRFYGGHRLWSAPEDPIRSYALDDLAMDISQEGDGLLIRKPVEPETGLEKSMLITLSNVDAKLTITHRLTNLGSDPVECAPWAITQFRTGGMAILPQGCSRTNLLPNRALAFWPYTDITSPHVTIGNRFILVRAEPQPPFKIGFPNPRGWLAYWLEGTLFVKQTAYHSGEPYNDFGSSSECYCNHQFLELETLAPLHKLKLGASALHTETWELFPRVLFPTDESAVQSLIGSLGLE